MTALRISIVTIECLFAFQSTLASASEDPRKSLILVGSILNASPNEVHSKLGKPDSSEKTRDCLSDMPSCTVEKYRSKKIEIIYYKNKMKYFSFASNDLFDKNGPELIGFANLPPTFSNKFVRAWRSASHRGTATGPTINIKGLRYIELDSPVHNGKYNGDGGIRVHAE